MDPKRSVAIDLLRAVAVLLVLFRHAPPSGALASPITKALETGGWIGVSLFFVLSGYLVSGLIWKEIEQTERFNISRFLIRRGLKIYPAFYLMIAFSVIIFLIRPGHVDFSQILAEVLFVQNYFPGIWNHTWSLAVEEHFYLLLALLAWLLIKFKISPKLWILLLCGLSISVCFILRFNISSTPYAHESHLFPTHLRIDALAFGVILQIANRKSVQFA